MKILATADLHFNHPRSRALADGLIREINDKEYDLLLLAGDTAPGDGDALEQCLSSFTFAGPKAFICGNHELWTRTGDSHSLFTDQLPRRVRSLGWHWLEGDPLVLDDVAIVGTVGWYDYSFAADNLAIPRRFYEAKVSPGAAARLSEHEHLIGPDVTPHHLEIVARWNDGRYVQLKRSDTQFLEECLQLLRQSLEQVRSARRVVAAAHHVPFAELLPPRRGESWDFAWAYLGSKAIGDVLAAFANVSHVICGHSHFPMDEQIGHIRAVNVGSGYRQKRYVIVDL